MADIEKDLDNPSLHTGIQRQHVTQALIAAKLSRSLERPRVETDGRFSRAIRLAKANGTYRQQLMAKYQHIWSSYWWFDDFHFVNDAYEEFEKLAIQSDSVNDLELLSNILTLLCNAVLFKHLAKDSCLIEPRIERLKLILMPLASDKTRPTNALEAKTLLLTIKLQEKLLAGIPEGLNDIWEGFSSILDEANNLGEFDFGRLINLMEVTGDLAPNDSHYTQLIEKAAVQISERKSEGEGALILLKRAQKLTLKSNLELIRILGKVCVQLHKKEYLDHKIEALQLLTTAYESAGLLWAARDTCLFLAASLSIRNQEQVLPPLDLISAMSKLAEIGLQLGNIPDFIFSIQLMRGCLHITPLSDESKSRLKNVIEDLDILLAIKLLNASEQDFVNLEVLPNILEALELHWARNVYLVSIGYLDEISKEGYFFEHETTQQILDLVTALTNHPQAEKLKGPLHLFSEGYQSLYTYVIGMQIEIKTSGNTQSLVIAEATLSAIEAFFATVLDKKVVPLVEKLSITLLESNEITEPSFVLKKQGKMGIITWPLGLSSSTFENKSTLNTFLIEIMATILATSCIVDDAFKLVEKLFSDESVQNRVSMASNAANSYVRLASKPLIRLTEWEEFVQSRYPARKDRPIINLKTDSYQESELEAIGADHRSRKVESVIDIPTWDEAIWHGTGFVTALGTTKPPYMALIFESELAAKKIFKTWLTRFGKQDSNDEIYISIIRELPNSPKYHYRVLVTSNFFTKNKKPSPEILTTMRYNTMEPASDKNLELFLHQMRSSGSYFICPAIIKNGNFIMLEELAILKSQLSVKSSNTVGRRDIEYAAIKVL